MRKGYGANQPAYLDRTVKGEPLTRTLIKTEELNHVIKGLSNDCNSFDFLQFATSFDFVERHGTQSNIKYTYIPANLQRTISPCSPPKYPFLIISLSSGSSAGQAMACSASLMGRLAQFRFEPASGWQSAATFFLLVTGALVTTCKLLSFLRALFSIFILPGQKLTKFGPKGSWAVVTGASEGIGREFSLQLARAGYNILLISRSSSKLTAVANEIKTKTPTAQTKIHAMDFSANNDLDYEKLKALIQDLDVSILVNNVGRSHSIPTPFVLTPLDEMEDIITINCLGTLRITQLVAPAMMQRKRGLILIMASFAGMLPTPLLATYSGSKAFLQYWSTALGSELEPYGVQVQLVQSHLVTSAMSKIRRTSVTIPNPRDMVRATLSKIGRGSGLSAYAYTSAPYWSHGLMAFALTQVLGKMGKFVLGYNKAMHESIRKRALRKAEREKGRKST
ncbi:long-chain 3-oxoacyl-CoA reductase [Paracoccidioides brasiliensis]|nr:long-chain 3-oxoacyl-CoA reductase [Paracoccidioides brasiliensis]